MKPLRGAMLLCLLLPLICLAGNAVDWRLDRVALQESLASMPRWQRARWLQDRNLPVPWQQSESDCPDSGLRVVGRWSYGPAVSVDVKATATDTFLFLARGSGVSIIRFGSQGSPTFDLLADINSRALTGHVIAQDTLLYVNCAGVEVYGISNPAEPRLLGHLSATITDFSVTDTFLYTISGDSFRAYSVADPANVRRIGGCRDSGAVMTVLDGYAYLGHRYGLHILDVRNPAQPRRIAAIGADVISVAVRDTLLVFGHYEQGISVYSVADPAIPRSLGSVPGVVAPGLFIPPTCDTVLYTPSLDVISLADPRSPRVLGQVSCPGWDNGVAAAPALNYAFVADDFDGFVAVNITTPSLPRIDTAVYAAGSTQDVVVDGGRAYAAQYFCGMRIIDISDPTRPQLLGGADTAGQLPPTRAVVARDSFAYIGWTTVPYLRSFEVSDPSRPVMHGGCDITNKPEDMVLRDTLLYVAEAARFQVVNVARPREPRLVGSCMLPDQSGDLTLQGNTAYVTNDGLFFVDIANPQLPQVVGTWPSWALGVEVMDTVAYCSGVYFFATVSVANLSMPRTLDSLWLVDNLMDVAVVDSFAYAGGNLLRIFNCADPSDVRQVGSWTPPYAIRRVIYEPPYLYVACWDAGICILETTQVGIAERDGDHGPTVGTARGPTPNPAGGTAVLRVPSCGAISIEVYNVAGARVTDRVRIQSRGQTLKLGVGRLAPGVYLVDVETVEGRQRSKLVKN